MTVKKNIKEIPLTGKLITSEDPAIIGTNFQKLTNMRYTEASIKGIGGHSKINTTALTNPKIRSAIQFRKNDNSNVLVEAYDSNSLNPKIYENTTAIPNTGDFNASEIFSPQVGDGRFSEAPSGFISYCNGLESCIYGGEESKVSGFINYAPDDSFSRDQTEQVQDSISTGSGHIATVKRVTGSTADDVLLLHLDGSDTDSSTSNHTVTDTNVTYTSSNAKFGTHQAVLNGSNANFSVPVHTDFDFSGVAATWTIDFWGTIDSLSSVNPIYYQQTDASNYFSIFITTNGEIKVSNLASGSEVLNSGSGFISSAAISTSGQYHIEIDRDGSDWYIFVDGQIKGYLSDSTDVGTFTGNILIGTDGSNFYDGDIDEYRVSSIATHTGNFDPPDSAYGDGFATYIYIGFILPVDGIKFYLSTVNTTTSSTSIEDWTGSEWSPVSSLSDGTSSGSKSFTQTGTISFSSTVDTASLKEINGVVVYWYRVKITSCDDNIGIYKVTGSMPFQSIKDIWDGMPSMPLSFLKHTTAYEDYTVPIVFNDYLDGVDSTYVDLSGMTSSQSLIIGFEERQLGIRFSIIGDYGNAVANTIATVEYWDSSDWVSVGAISDKTSKTGISFEQAGLITWNQIGNGIEFKTEFTGSNQTTPTLYFYRISFNNTLTSSNGPRLDTVTGIPAQKEISTYSFSLNAMNRLWLFSNQAGIKNTSICSAEHTATTFNGENSIELVWGGNEEITGAEWLYSQYGASVYSILVVFKKNETWVLIGTNPETWKKYKISSSIGCVSPKTIKVIELPMTSDNSVNRSSVILFQGADGIYMTDGRPPMLISKDLDVFDKRKGLINDIYSSFAFVDIENEEYHWCYANSTYADSEMVLDYSKMQWYQTERPNPLQFGIEVKTTDGSTYNYGFIDGYCLRLEHSNSFDGTGIEQIFRFGDIALDGNHVATETSAEYHNLIVKSKDTINTITITHYGDSSLTGNSFTLSLVKPGYRLIRSSEHKTLGSHIFHSWEFSLTTDDETTGFEPLFFSCLFHKIRQYIKDYR